MPDKTIVRATPAARFYAKEHKVELSEVKGTGPKGRIHKCDVEDYISAGGNIGANGGSVNANVGTAKKASPLAKKIAEVEGLDIQNINGTGPNGRVMKKDVMDALRGENKAQRLFKDKEGALEATEVIPMTSMRKVIARRMSESYFKAPTFLMSSEIDMTNLLSAREQLKQIIIDETGIKPSITDFISFGVIKSLMKHPYVNATLSEDEKNIYIHNFVNLAIAVGSDNGLVVPVVDNAHKMSLKELVAASSQLIKKATTGKLKPNEMQGSTFTISNLGMYDVDSFTAIINQPNSAILAVSSTKKKPVVVDDQIVIRAMMNMTLTSDHRVIDGLEAAKFMQTLKFALENPLTMLI